MTLAEGDAGNEYGRVKSNRRVNSLIAKSHPIIPLNTIPFQSPISMCHTKCQVSSTDMHLPEPVSGAKSGAKSTHVIDSLPDVTPEPCAL